MDKLLAGPLEVAVDGAQAYWLGDLRGSQLSPESERTLAPCARALALTRTGIDPDTLVLWARLADGELYQVSAGLLLLDMAEAAAGIPARQRAIRE